MNSSGLEFICTIQVDQFVTSQSYQNVLCKSLSYSMGCVHSRDHFGAKKKQYVIDFIKLHSFVMYAFLKFRSIVIRHNACIRFTRDALLATITPNKFRTILSITIFSLYVYMKEKFTIDVYIKLSS